MSAPNRVVTASQSDRSRICQHIGSLAAARQEEQTELAPAMRSTALIRGRMDRISSRFNSFHPLDTRDEVEVEREVEGAVVGLGSVGESIGLGTGSRRRGFETAL